jgi:hypothetical protein
LGGAICELVLAGGIDATAGSRLGADEIVTRGRAALFFRDFGVGVRCAGHGRILAKKIFLEKIF